MRNVDPPTGIAARGPPMSHTVKVTWELRGRSQYRIGKVIHSFQLRVRQRHRRVVSRGPTGRAAKTA